jgi:hypothetical protein
MMPRQRPGPKLGFFAGKRLLKRPFNEVLGSGRPDLPFCLCSANTTRRGHGEPNPTVYEPASEGQPTADHQSARAPA